MDKIGIVLCDTLPMPPVKGGAVENLLQTIIDQNERQGDLELLVYSIWDKKLNEVSLKFHNTQYIYYRPSKLQRAGDILLKVLRRISRQWFSKLTPSLYEIEAYLSLKKQGVRKVILANCPYYAPYINRKNEFHLIQYLHNDYLKEKNALTAKVFQHTQQYIGVSEFITKRVKEAVDNDIQIDVCYNGIEIDLFSNINQSDVAALRKRLQLKEDDKVIVFVGRLTENKGVMELLKAFGRLSKEHTNWKLVIVGGLSFSSDKVNEYVAKLKQTADKIGNQVRMVGYVDYRLIPVYLHTAHLCVIPSTEYESFNLSSVEAQASGLPVIVSDAGGIVETVTDKSGVIVKRDGFFVENIAKSIELILADDGLRERMSEAAIESANRYPAEAMYRKFVELVK